MCTCTNCSSRVLEKIRMSSQYTCTIRPSIGGAGPTELEAGQALPVESNAGVPAENVVHKAHQHRGHAVKPKVPTWNSYWSPGTRNDGLYWSSESSRIRNCI